MPVSFYGVEPPISGPYVQASAGKHRGSLDRLTAGEFPQERTMSTVQSIEEAVVGAKVDPGANDHRRGHNGSFRLKLPELCARQGLPGIQGALGITNIHRLGGYCG